jgi:hypothetical protein
MKKYPSPLHKNILPQLPPNLKGKKQGITSACLGLPIGCMKFLFPKEFINNFGVENLISNIITKNFFFFFCNEPI